MGSPTYVRALGMGLWHSHLCVFWQLGQNLSQHEQMLELLLRNQSALFVRAGRLSLP